MRYILLFLLPTIAVDIANAQLVITGETYTNADDVLYYEAASPQWLLETDAHLISGSDQIWDVSDWAFLSETDESYVDVGDTPGTYQFFFSNQFLYPENFSTHGLAVETGDLDLPLPFEVSEPYGFFRNDDEGYFQTGTAFSIEGLPIITRNDISDRILTFPLEYDNLDSTESAYLTTVPFLGVYGQTGTRVSHVDGWGTLITPNGAFDVLRISAKRELVDTIYIEQIGTGQEIVRPVQFDYMWISPDVPGPILEMTVINDVLISARMNAGTGTVGIKEQTLEGVSLYPNPTKDKLFIDWGTNTKGTVRIYSTQGQQLISENRAVRAIDISKLPAGIYLAEITSESKFTIQKFVVLGE